MPEAVTLTPAKDTSTTSDLLAIQESPIFSGFPKLLTNPKFSDVTVRVGVSPTETYKLHRAILSERSTYFDRICNGPFVEAQTQEIKLPEITPAVFSIVVRYLYTGEYLDKAKKCTVHELSEVYETADYLDIPGLKTLIMDTVWKRVGNTQQDLDLNFVVTVLEILAKTSYSTPKLEKLIRKILERRKLSAWMQREPFKELLDKYGVIGRLIIENSNLQGMTELSRGWAKEIKPKVHCGNCKGMRELANNNAQFVTFALQCGHISTV
ncbi:hypothetical protein ABW19_dt0210065 [Dactylella cylindrospora]|nr:hypothetical protein ABW19_dt0210065 [Dactylella cylindrospora]